MRKYWGCDIKQAGVQGTRCYTIPVFDLVAGYNPYISLKRARQAIDMYLWEKYIGGALGTVMPDKEGKEVV